LTTGKAALRDISTLGLPIVRTDALLIAQSLKHKRKESFSSFLFAGSSGRSQGIAVVVEKLSRGGKRGVCILYLQSAIKLLSSFCDEEDTFYH